MIDGSFRAPADVAPEVRDYFRAKNLAPAFSWLDVWGEEHAYAFTVAKAVEEDVLVAFRASIDQAIRRGETFEAWRGGVEQHLRNLGWWGKRQVTDPLTGLTSAVDFSAPRRLKTIFWSNMRAARASGQWERAQRTKEALPYFLYVRTTADEPREEHLAWAGTLLPVDDPFWTTHFPPNGWGCKCSVRQISRAEAATRGGMSARPASPTKRFVNRRTGEVTQVPVGIDPGWHTNPGLARARTLLHKLDDTLARAGEKRARRQIETLWTPPFRRLFVSVDERIRAPAGLSARAQAALDATSPLIAISNDTLGAKVAKHGHVPAIGEIAAHLPQMIADGEHLSVRPGEVWVFGQAAGRLWKIVLRRSAAGFMRVQTIHPSGPSHLAGARARTRK